MQLTGSAMLPLFMMLQLAGCSADSPNVGSARVQNEAQRCIKLDQIAGRRVVGQSVQFEMSNGINYRNDFTGACPGLERLGPTATISVVSGGEGGQLCRGDRIRVADPVEAIGSGLASAPTCALGDFQSQPAAQ